MTPVRGPRIVLFSLEEGFSSILCWSLRLLNAACWLLWFAVCWLVGFSVERLFGLD